jgi:hypothetical protein
MRGPFNPPGGIDLVDEEIRPLVRALWDAGIATVASCSGHDYRPGNIALADGRELVIAPDYETARKIDALFPLNIQGEPCEAPELNPPADVGRGAAYEQALRDIIDPLGMLKREAEAKGQRLSGQAYSIANNLHFVQAIARKALEVQPLSPPPCVDRSKDA